MRHIALVFLLALTFVGCDRVKESLPSSQSNGGAETLSGVDELLVVMDQNVRDSEFGQRLIAYIRDDYKIIPPHPERAEPKMNMTIIQGSEFIGDYKKYHNVLIVGFMADQGQASTLVKTALTTDEKKGAIDGGGDFIKTEQDVYAKGQTVVYFFANQPSDFMPQTEPYFDAMMAEFMDAAIPYYRKLAYYSGENAEASNLLVDKYGGGFKVPEGYKVALSNDSLTMLRYDEGLYTIFVFQMVDSIEDGGEYFPNRGIEIRDRIGKEYVEFKEPEGNYMKTDSTLGFVHRIIDLNGMPAYENRGLWRQEDSEGFTIGGGPFINYYILDEAHRKAYFMEGFIFAPGEKKRGQMRKLESVLRTFSLKEGA